VTMARDIIYIDDEPEQLLVAARASRAGNRFYEFIPPNLEGADDAAAGANLWVFDFFNDDAERENPDIKGVISNGLSVFQQLRLLVGDARPPAVVVSNHLEAALGSVINLDRRHILAEEVGVEWVTPKVQADGDVVAEILALANATAALREISAQLCESEPIAYVADLARLALKLPHNVEWTRAAVRDVAAWRPPTWSDAKIDQRPQILRQHLPVQPDLRSVRSVLAWLIRQALPYPSFLLRDRHLAIHLGLSLESVRAALAAETQLARRLKRVAYRGVLADFEGDRWWSAGVDALAFALPRQQEQRDAALVALLDPVPMAKLGLVDPVVVSDADLVETDEIAAASECVRAADEHFPPHAPSAWVKIEDARQDRALARKVKLEDQPELAIVA
jgi:hypothetical protein